MARAWSSGLAVLAAVAAGCGGALSDGAGGAGGGAGAGIMTGGAGTTGQVGGAGGSPYERGYTWGNTFVYVGPGETVADSLTYTAQEDIVFKAMATLPAATDFPPTNGARVIAHYGCASAALYALDVEGCARLQDGTTAPGCVSFEVSDQGMTGEFVDAAGARCIAQSGSANIYVPLPDFSLPADPGAPRYAASGGFSFFCTRPDGPIWYVGGMFAVPATSTFLACAD